MNMSANFTKDSFIGGKFHVKTIRRPCGRKI